MEKEMQELLDKSNPSVRKLALAARDMVRQVVPEGEERIYPRPRMLSYGFSAKMKAQFCAIITHKEHVNVQFARGVDLPDPEHLLEGTGKKVRHVKIRTVEDVQQEALKTLVQEAAVLTQASL
ncbi:MAG TPA: DUF1801 domain-containing protein [Rhodothermales bacterium]|nr:DUF1801 domain-containing protein [Rhodothermales bacterium]